MIPQSGLEIKGNFFTHPFAELLVEIAQAGLSGSLRVSDQETKCVIYFKGGKTVFAVSNARATRLFDVLIRQGKLKKEDLAQCVGFSNDFELSGFLIEKNFLSKAESDRLFTRQIENILVSNLTSTTGEWTFSPLARIRDGLAFDVDLTSHLVNYSRCLSADAIAARFRSLEETFERAGASEMGRDLTMEEGFVLSRIENDPISVSAVLSLCVGTAEPIVISSLYTLWLGNLLVRGNWNPAFSRETIAAIKNAKLELKAEAKDLHAVSAQPVRAVEKSEDKVKAKPENSAPTQAPVISLEEYLNRVEKAVTFYDILGIDPKAEADELKKAYFLLARNFHPDRYHSEGGARLKRIQSAFTELAQAYETVKNPETREIYDYRMRKEIADREKRQAAGAGGNAHVQLEQAAENFERGFSLLADGSADSAVPFLARAAHFAPTNARYRAYYGRALAFDEKHRHKAEAEMQAALKIDPNNPAFRIMLAEFFIKFGLPKRAEGELTRLLNVFPGNREAREMLAGLK